MKLSFLVDTSRKLHIFEILSLISTNAMQYLWSMKRLRSPGPTAVLTKLEINPVFYSWRAKPNLLYKYPKMAGRLDREAGLAGGFCLLSEYSAFINLPHPSIPKTDDWIRSSFGSGLVRLRQSRCCSC